MRMMRLFVILPLFIIFVFGSLKVSAQCVDSMIISDVQALPGDTVIVPVYIRTCGIEGVGDLNGVTFCMKYDPTQLEAISIDSAGTVLETYPPQGWMPYVNSDSGWVTLGIIEQYIGDGLILPGRYHLFNIVFYIRNDAEAGITTLDIKDGILGMTNTFTYQMPVTDVYPELSDGDFAVLPDSLTLIFNPAPPYSLSEGENLSVEVTAVDSNSTHFVTLSAAGLMENMSFPETSDFFFVTNTFTFYPNQCQAGVYNVVFFADCDFGCHVETPVTITVDNINRIPGLDAGPDQVIIAGDTLVFTVMATDSDYWECRDDTLHLSASNLPGEAAFAQESDTTGIFSWVPSFADTGDYTVIFLVEDLTGAADTESVEITVLPHTLDIVTIPDPPPTTVNEGSALTFDVRATDSSIGHIVDLYAIYLPANATFPPESGAGSVQSTFTFDPGYCQAGVDSVVFQAQCSGGLAITRTVYLTVNDVPRAPSIEAGGPYSAKPNHLLTFSVIATDLDLLCGDDTLTLSAFNLPGGATFSQNSGTTGIFSWTPVEADTGSYTITFVVDDHTALADSDEATIKVVVYDFEDVTEAALVGDEGPGHGVAWGDWDGDGDLDIYVVNYNEPNVLYRNNGDDTFTNVAAAAGVANAGPGYGSAWGDFDNDGDLDLYVTNDGPNILYRNNGDGTLTDVTSIAGVGNAGWGRGAAWGDFDNDGYLDLYVVNSLSSQASVLYHNNGDRTFTDVASIAGVEFMGNGRGVGWGDYDADGDLDLYVVNYWPGGSALYRNNSDGTFTNVAGSAGVENNGLGTGVAWGDYDADGYLDLYVVNYGGYGNFLYQNNGNGTFSDVTQTAGVGLVDNGYGTAWADYDLDGDLDLYVVNYRGGRKAYGANVLFANNSDGTFSDATERAGVGDLGYGYGTAWGDYDNDGDLDLYVVNHDQANILYQNQVDNVDFIKVTVVGAAYLAPGLSNRDGVGAKVKVYQAGTGTLLGFREIRGGSGYCSMNSLEAEFGLDHNHTYDLKVVFPKSGVVRVHSNLSTGQKVVVYEERAPLSFSLISPTDGDTAWSLTPTLTWQWSVDPDPGDSVTYTVYYSPDSTFATYDSVADVRDTTCSLPELTDDTVYYWKVKGKDNWGLEVWSVETFSFNVYFPEAPNVFSLLYPTDGDTIYANIVTIDWEDASDPDPGDSVLYTIYYGTSPEFHPDSTTIVDSLSESQYHIASKELAGLRMRGRGDPLKSNVTSKIVFSENNPSEISCFDNPSGLPDDAKIYWKVKAFDIFGLETWSSQIDWNFQVYVPEPPIVFNLVSPADRDTIWSLIPTLTWQRAVDPDPGDSVTYTVYYSTDSTFAIYDSLPEVGDTTCTLPILTDDATYYWKVKGTDSFGLETWSVKTFSFNTYLVEPPDPFDLLSPTDGDTVYAALPIRLNWDDASDPDPGDIILYTLYLSLNSDFSDSMAIDSLSESEYTLDQTMTSIEDKQVRDLGFQIAPEMKLGMGEEEKNNNTAEVIENGWSNPKGKVNPDSLLADTTYYWKVKAYDRWGTERWSNQLSWNFYVQLSSLFIRGDYDGDGNIFEQSDFLKGLAWMFNQPGAQIPTCLDALDYDDDGNCKEQSDFLSGLAFIFNQPGGVPPELPYPACGPDLTSGDTLDCQQHDYCMGGGKVAHIASVSVEGAKNVLSIGSVSPTTTIDSVIVVVPVELVNAEPLSGFEYTISFDPYLASLVTVDNSGLITESFDFFAFDINAQAGKVRIGNIPSFTFEKNLPVGTRQVAKLVFQLQTDNFSEDIPLKFSNAILSDLAVNDLDCKWVSGAIEPGILLPKHISLSQNCPNPFNSTTEIKYTLPIDAWVKLDVYNILGQKVATLVDEEQKAGCRRVDWDGSEAASGVYFYLLQVRDLTTVKKMILLR